MAVVHLDPAPRAHPPLVLPEEQGDGGSLPGPVSTSPQATAAGLQVRGEARDLEAIGPTVFFSPISQ